MAWSIMKHKSILKRRSVQITVALHHSINSRVKGNYNFLNFKSKSRKGVKNQIKNEPTAITNTITNLSSKKLL
ncbi:hypothetical protein TSUD_183130 [Trifolium subterraneum]|uniref:Uncharacterized protein n=1 Tax=Trifolium subterraneum TaxID=3900 RepID=A0A2Z6P9N9_TRISU|nr:hypothetical protein TSUD_183130 [Trifolium subterraneum]